MSAKSLKLNCHPVCIGLAILIMYLTGGQSTENPSEFFTLTFENDFFVGDDNGYTYGIGIIFGKTNTESYS
ncbi:MAG: hypothetical protein ACI845_002390 [Gammaproteobacteria bacterium]|jgi:hypothetical protein